MIPPFLFKQFNVRAWEKEMFALYSTCYGRNSTLAKSEQEEYQLQGGEEVTPREHAAY